jgi:hypothetical protein
MDKSDMSQFGGGLKSPALDHKFVMNFTILTTIILCRNCLCVENLMNPEAGMLGVQI